MADRVPTRGGACARVIPARYVLAVLGSIAMALVYGLKVNLSVAIVSMVNNTALAHPAPPPPVNVSSRFSAINSSVAISDSIVPRAASSSSDDCVASSAVANETTEDGPFPWPKSIQGALKSSYFWGYIVAQVPGGRIAEKFSAKWVMFFSVAINVVCTILSPISAKCHYGVFLLMRIAEGIGGGVTFPAMHVMLASWAPPNERSVMSSIVYAGTALGTVIFTLITGLIASSLGWEAIFYIEGSAAAIWLIFWVLLIADTPDKQSFITQEEREYITSSLNAGGGGHGSQGPKPPVPWKKVFTSPPFLAILVAHTCSNWGWYMVLIELPNYMKNVLHLPIAKNAVLSAVPFLTMWLFSMILSKTLDTLRSKNMITTTTARKIGTLIASVIPMICFIALCYIGCLQTLAIVLMTLAITSVGGMFSGFLSNHIDIAPNFAGTLMAITNSCATIPGIVVPIFVGKLTQDDPSIESWRIVFWVTIVLYVIEIITYGIFGSGEEQKWNRFDDQAAGEAQPLRATNK